MNGPRSLYRPSAEALRIALVYGVVGTLWIALSDHFLLSLGLPPEVLTRFQTLKGGAFVLATGLLLFFLIRSSANRLQSHERTFRALFDETFQFTGLLSPEGIVLEVNRSALRFSGLDRAQVVGAWIWSLPTWPDDGASRQALKEAVQKAAAGRFMRFEISAVPPQGSRRILDLSIKPVLNAAGEVLQLVIEGRDLTEHKQAEAEIRRQKELLESIFDHTPLMITLLDEQGRVRMMNRAAEEILLTSEQEALEATDFFDRFYPDPAERQRVYDSMNAAPNTWWDFETTLSDGRVIDTAWMNVLLSNGMRIGIGQDVTERRKAEETLRRAHKMEAVGQLSSGLAHDFNNLLGIMVGNLSLLEAQTADLPTFHARVRTVLRAAERGSELTRRLLGFARHQTGRHTVVDTNAVLGAMEELLARSIGEQISLTLVTDPDLPLVRIEPESLQDAVLNLVLNARDAMTGGGSLQIETSHRLLADGEVPHLPAGSYAMLAVHDTGTGIAAEHLEHVFEPFFTTKPPGRGTGLGLSMVYGFARRSAGSVTIASAPTGTTVRLFLPCTDAPASFAWDTDARHMDAWPRGQETILVVDDEPALAEVAAATLGALGYQTLVAHGGEAALALLNEQTVDLLFSDVIMPGPLDGPGLARKAQSLQPGLRVLLTSGGHRSMKSDGPPPFQDLLIPKPYAPATLAHAIRRVLDNDTQSAPLPTQEELWKT